MATAFARQAATAPAARLCSACVDVLQVSGAGVTIMSGSHSGPVCSSDPTMARLEELQFSLGEGPARDAYASGEPVTEPDLRQPSSERWPNFSPPALELGAGGVFSFPLRSGASRVGVLTLYQLDAGVLSSEQTRDCLIVAQVLARTMLSIQGRSGPQVLSPDLVDSSAHRAEVHQASGMVAVQLGVDMAEALVRLRAHAFANDQSVATVAQQIVARRLRLSDDRAVGGTD